MSQNTIYLLQSLLVFLQIANAGLATMKDIHPLITIILAAAIGALQGYLQKVGNESVSPQVKSMLTPEQLCTLPGQSKKEECKEK